MNEKLNKALDADNVTLYVKKMPDGTDEIGSKWTAEPEVMGELAGAIILHMMRRHCDLCQTCNNPSQVLSRMLDAVTIKVAEDGPSDRISVN